MNEILQARPTFLQALIERERSDQPGSAEAFGGAEAAPRLLVRARLTWWAGRAGDALILMRQAAAADARSPIASAVLAEGYQTIARDGALALRELRKRPTRPLPSRSTSRSASAPPPTERLKLQVPR